MICQAFCNEESFRWVDRSMLAWHVPKPTKSFFSGQGYLNPQRQVRSRAGRVVPVLEVRCRQVLPAMHPLSKENNHDCTRRPDHRCLDWHRPRYRFPKRRPSASPEFSHSLIEFSGG
jgi:hypothetical protein